MRNCFVFAVYLFFKSHSTLLFHFFLRDGTFSDEVILNILRITLPLGEIGISDVLTFCAK